MEFESYLRSMGLDPSNVSADQKVGLRLAWRKSQAVPFALDVSPEDGLATAMATHADNPVKLAHLRELGEQRSEMTESEYKLKLLRLSRFDGPMVFNPGGNDRGPVLAEVLTASICGSLGMSGDKLAATGTDPRVIDAAMSREHRGASLHTLFRNVLASHGERAPNRYSDGDIRRIFQLDAQASVGPSTGVQVSGILSNVANKSLMTSYAGTPTTWNRWCNVTSNKDFKEAKSYRMTMDGTLQEVAPAGELKHMGLQEASETSTLKTYGGLIGLDRREIINDDLGAFSKIPNLLGRQAAVGLEKAVYTPLLANAGPFFVAGNSNYLSGGGSVLALAGLGTAASTFSAQLDANGDPLFLPASILLVPPILGPAARTLVSSATIIDGTGSAAQPDGNPFAGMYQVVEAPYLGLAAGLAGASNTGWYLMGPAGDFSPVSVAFLNGVQQPTIESAEFNFDRLGMAWRCVFDFGVALHDHRGGVLSAGA